MELFNENNRHLCTHVLLCVITAYLVVVVVVIITVIIRIQWRSWSLLLQNNLIATNETSFLFLSLFHPLNYPCSSLFRAIPLEMASLLAGCCHTTITAVEPPPPAAPHHNHQHCCHWMDERTLENVSLSLTLRAVTRRMATE